MFFFSRKPSTPPQIIAPKKFDPEDHGLNKPPAAKPRTVLVVDPDEKHNWYKLFEGCLDDKGLPVRVEQCGFEDMQLASYSTGSGCWVDIARSKKPIPGTSQNQMRTVKPDIVLIRSTVRSLDIDYRNLLYGLQYGCVAGVNSLESIYGCLERPWVFAELIKIQKRLGSDVFPLIEQNYYSNHREMLITPQYPVVLKVSHAHAGYGKVRLENHHQFEDIRSLVALHQDDYATAEPFIEGEYDLRIQKIGSHYRAFKRISISGNWKTNTGTSVVESIPLTDQYKLWVDECAKIFGGLDILAVDAIHASNGKEYILEVNDSAIGLCPDTEEEDSLHIRDVVMEKLLAQFPASSGSSSSSAGSSTGAV